MGQSTNGILVFGVDLGDVEDVPEGLQDEEGDFDFENIISRDAGLVEPCNGTDEDYRKFWSDRRKAAAEAPVCLVYHCSGDYPMYILGIPETENTATRGYPTTLLPADLATPSAEKVEAFKKWCADHSVQLETEPAWLLCSYWS